MLKNTNGWTRLFLALSALWFVGFWVSLITTVNFSYYEEKARRDIGRTLGGLSHAEQQEFDFLNRIDPSTKGHNIQRNNKQIFIHIKNIEYDWLDRITELSLDVSLSLRPPFSEDSFIELYPIKPAQIKSKNQLIPVIETFLIENNLPVHTNLPLMLSQYDRLTEDSKTRLEKARKEYLSEWSEANKSDIKALAWGLCISTLPPLLILCLFYLARWILIGFRDNS